MSSVSFGASDRPGRAIVSGVAARSDIQLAQLLNVLEELVGGGHIREVRLSLKSKGLTL
jgi:hypothetical protein